MRGLLAELKRRRVFRVAGLYGIVSWVIAEVSSVVFPVLLLPEWTVTFVVALLICGFPIAVLLAWAYDIGPGGIERTAPASAVAPAGRGTWLAYGLMLLVAMGGLGWFLWSRMQAPQAGEYDSIAVLPFANLSGDEQYDYFSDGMAEELLNLLAKVPGLQVAARTSSFAFRDANVAIPEIGRRLGVDTVLEGSVRRSGDRVRITAQLVDSGTGYHLWSETYDRRIEDIFDVQDTISREIVKSLRGTFASTQGQPPASLRSEPPTESLDAYQLYLQARHQWKRRGAESVRRSIELFQQALEADPDYARAWAGLAAAWVVLPGYTGEEPEEYYERAADAARQALAHDETLAEAHAVLAEIQVMEWDWTGAEGAFFFATNLDPNDATSHHWYALLLMRTGRLSEALEQARKAFELDPASPVINSQLAESYLALGYDDQARRFAESARELGFDNVSGDSVESVLALRNGDVERFRAILRESVAQVPLPESLADAVVAAWQGELSTAELSVMLDEHDVPGWERLTLWVLLGEGELALEALDAVAERKEGDFTVVWMPEGRSVRQDPRFAAFAREAGLVRYWKQYGMPDDCRLIEDKVSCGFTAVAAAY